MSKLFRTTVKAGKNKVFTKLKSFAKSVEINKELKQEIGSFAVDRMQRTARSGKSIATGKSFAPLAKSTISFRKSLAKYNQTNALFKANRSNLTIIGELIDSISYQIKGKTIDIRPRGTHSGYKTKPGQKTGGWSKQASLPKSNEEIAQSLLNQGRVFVGLDKTGVDRINRIIAKYARKLLRLK